MVGNIRGRLSVPWLQCARDTIFRYPASQSKQTRASKPEQDTAHCWDDRRNNLAPGNLNIRHKEFRVPINRGHKPVWVDSQPASTNFRFKAIFDTVPTLVAGAEFCAAIEDCFDARICRKPCVDGELSDVVDALHLLVQHECHVSSDLFYRALKRCIQNKNLPLGRRIHALTLKCGYEGDAFLATHLIGLYASHGRLEEAMGVFLKVATPDAYNWATIILGYARHGGATEAAQAIRLYRQMREWTSIQPDEYLYTAVLKACAGAMDLVAGKEVHAHILTTIGNPNRFVQSGLVNMYAKCGSVEDARRLFNKLSAKNVVTWNAMISGYAQQGLGAEALILYRSMQKEATSPDSVTYVCLLQACASLGVGALEEGKFLHAELRKSGLHKGLVIGTSLVNMYAKCGSLVDARDMFNNLPQKNVVAWNAMIGGYAQQGMGLEALDLYRNIRREGLTRPDAVTYVCLLQACASVGVEALDDGLQLHAEIRERGLQKDLILGRSLVNMYAKCGSIENARKLFDELPERNIVAWNAIIVGYAHQGKGQESLILYRCMQQDGVTPDYVTYVGLLQACASVGVEALDDGKQLHADIRERGLENDLVLGGSLVNMYAKCGRLELARIVFDKLPEKNVVAWNVIISGYSQKGMGAEALRVYKGMQEGGFTPDYVTYLCLLQACAAVGAAALEEGRQLHADIIKHGVQERFVLDTSLINMYCKCGSLDVARKLFDKLLEKNVQAWNAMIAGYAHWGMGQEALTLYRTMQQEGLIQPDSVTYVSTLQACASVGVGAHDDGQQLHAEIKAQGLEEDRVLSSSLINMYAKCGGLEEARAVFDRLSNRCVVTWTAMITGYAQQGMGQEALSLYSKMQRQGLTPDSVTYVCLLQACAAVAALPLGEQLHMDIEERQMLADGSISAALVNMYAKCGSMYDAQRVFDSLSERSIETWGVLLSGYARQGDSDVVFDLLERMQVEGVCLDEITFLGVLTVCSHVGLVDKGRKYFEAMQKDHGICATMEHFVCMVDLLGRGGHLEEALQMAKTMPFPPNGVLWRTLLGACRKWKNVDIGLQAFKGAMGVDEKDAASYVLMANIYARAQMWEAAKEMQARRMFLGAWKKPGQSWWTDEDGLVHTFTAGDKKHPESEGIYVRLEQLFPKMKREGYAPHLDSSLLDIADDEKQAELCGHSEKLAIAYALNKTAEGTTIRIVKNLRVCEDCHAATACISKLERRIIICRDASRFHVFKEGRCSCGDYW